jgi:hypothetical protein
VLEPLIGEGPATQSLLEVPAEVLYDDAPTLAARELRQDILDGDWQGLWENLSPRAQVEIIGLTESPDTISGAEVASRFAAKLGGPQSLVAQLFGADLVEIRPFPPDAEPKIPPPTAGDGRALIYSTTATGEVREQSWVFDGSHWRLDSLPKLP